MTSVNSCQLKRNVTVHSGTADPSSAVGHCTVRDCTGVCGLGSGEQRLRYIRGVQRYRGEKNITHYKTLIFAIHGATQHVVLHYHTTLITLCGNLQELLKGAS